MAKKYNYLLKNNNKIKLPVVKNLCENAYFFFPILVNNRDRVAKNLKFKHGIDTRIAYKMPIYKQKVYENSKKSFKKLKCPIAEKITKKILNLPMFPSLKEKEILYIVNSLNKEI